MYRIGLALLTLSLVTLAPSHALVGGCGGGRMGMSTVPTAITPVFSWSPLSWRSTGRIWPGSISAIRPRSALAKLRSK
jgi:hypothetical protein